MLSFASVAELYRWAEERRWGDRRRQDLERHLSRYLVHPYNRRLCKAWARLMAHSASAGRKMRSMDAWVASVALVHSIPLLTANRKDFGAVATLIHLLE